MRRSFLLLILFLLLPGCAGAQQINQRGNQAFANRDYENALRDYLIAQAALPGQPEPGYNAANTLYQQGDLLAAQQRMLGAIAVMEASDMEDAEPLLQDAYFNLGNIYYHMEAYAAAIESYREALRLDPHDADTKHNLELALKKLQEAPEPPQAQTPQATLQGAQIQATPSARPDESALSTPTASPSEAETLTPGEARQLLETVMEGVQFLQPTLAAAGRPPAQDW